MSEELFSANIEQQKIGELLSLTGKKSIDDAISAAIDFTCMHDKDSIREALK